MKAKEKLLVKTAKELNKVCKPDPKIDLEGTKEELITGIKEVVVLIEEGDKFSEEVQAVIDEVLAEVAAEAEEEEDEDVPEPPKADKKKDKKEDKKADKKKVAAPAVEEDDDDEEEDDDDDDDDDDDEEEDASLYASVKAASKLAELKAIVTANKDFKKLAKIIDTFKNPFILKKAMTDILEEADPSILVKKAAAADAKKPVKDPNAPAKKNPFKKEPGVLSFQETADKLLADKADAKTILKTFVALYKERKSITDEKFVQGRADIYMKIAKKGKE